MVEDMKKQSSEIKKDKKEDKKLDKKDLKIKELEKQVEELREGFLRARADYDNFRKRVEKEREEIRDRSVINFVEDILPAIDNFEMSLKMTENKEMFIKGVEMIHKNLIDTLKAHNFEEFEVYEGEQFDPYLHEPVLIEDQSRKSGEIVGILKKGIKHKGNVVRAAKVQVVKEK